jgi:hypothetical protein
VALAPEGWAHSTLLQAGEASLRTRWCQSGRQSEGEALKSTTSMCVCVCACSKMICGSSQLHVLSSTQDVQVRCRTFEELCSFLTKLHLILYFNVQLHWTCACVDFVELQCIFKCWVDYTCFATALGRTLAAGTCCNFCG